MPYNSLIGRTEVVMAEDLSRTILDNAQDQSIAMSAFRRVTVSKNQQRFPVLAALPTAYWVNGDTGLKQTTEMAWTNKYLNVEELAAIVPIPEAVIADSDFDIWAEVRPKLETAIARALDAAVFFGVNAPTSFPTNVRAAATAAGNTVTAGTATAAEGGAFGDLDAVIAAVEADGFEVDTWAADRSLRSLLRAARSSQGDRLDRDRLNGDLTQLDGDTIIYGARGMWPAAATGVAGLRAIAFDSAQFVLGVRQDITYKVLDQAVIQDNAGAIQYNLAQQDMVALRVTFRVGWQVANPVTFDQPTEAQRYPAAVLETPAL